MIVFVIGGATFEESLWVKNQNEKRVANPALPTFLLASTHMLNTTRLTLSRSLTSDSSFVEQLSDLTSTNA